MQNIECVIEMSSLAEDLAFTFYTGNLIYTVN